jgi:hypothetical protein
VAIDRKYVGPPRLFIRMRSPEQRPAAAAARRVDGEHGDAELVLLVQRKRRTSSS